MTTNRQRVVHPLTINQRSMRVENCLVVLGYLRARGTASYQEMADAIGLSRTTLGSIVKDLCDIGFAVEVQGALVQNRTGRPAAQVRFRAEVGYFIGIDLGRTAMAVVVTELDVRRRIPPYRKVFDVAVGARVGFDEVAKHLRRVLNKWAVPLDPQRIVGIGIGLPGPLDHQRHQLVSGTKNLPGWSDIRLDEQLARSLNVWDEQKGNPTIPIYVDNDANLGALGVSHYNLLGTHGPAKSESHVVYVKLGAGIGAGLIKRGVLDYGAHGASGEIGHFTVVARDDAPECACGKRGCLETVASASAIIRAVASSDLDPTMTLDSALKDIAARARAGDMRCLRAFNEAGRYIGITLAAVVNTEDPAVVVLDGQVAQAAGELILYSIQEAMREATFPPVAALCRIVLAPSNSDAVAWGGIATVAEHALRSFVKRKLDAWYDARDDEKRQSHEKAVADLDAALLSGLPQRTGNALLLVEKPDEADNRASPGGGSGDGSSASNGEQ